MSKDFLTAYDENAAEVETKYTELRRALLTLYNSGAIDLQHVCGEINSLWEARETVKKFLLEE